MGENEFINVMIEHLEVLIFQNRLKEYSPRRDEYMKRLETINAKCIKGQHNLARPIDPFTGAPKPYQYCIVCEFVIKDNK